ncbi:hypothetical protein CAPTEDRAFT_207454 [Capitella teleta]|uniref:Uncharacterized protein n=1 Tax=Capitella teleta TaxID=283909 RepID=R7TLR3_CAPTE|nr:hypothetical protein CAPTEDRAFT_207454 [Capitella teleta]|eukprot:ELT94609.1 hypothetical protein CAPTEDRAFT_207454 [Capitella teleta]
MGQRSNKVEDQKTWVKERTSLYSRKCAPPPIVLCLTALLVLLALLLFAVAVFFMFFWPLPNKYYDVSVHNSATNTSGWVQPVSPDPTTTPGKSLPITTTTTATPAATQQANPASSARTSAETLSTVSTMSAEATTKVTSKTTADKKVTTEATTKVTTKATTQGATEVTTKVTSEGSTEVTTDTPCVDFEPELCAVGDPATLCSGIWGKAYCCNTCQTPSSCRDVSAGCFQVWYYGECNEGQYPTSCCVTCTYGGAPP